MPETWTVATLDGDADEGPPTDETWRAVTVPSRPAYVADADGPVAYRTTVGDLRASDTDRTFLTIRSEYGRVRAWANGQLLGVHTDPLESATFEFEPAERTDLIVVCDRERPNPNGPGGGLLAVTESLEDAISPRFDAAVETVPETFLADLAVTPRLTEEGGIIEAEVAVDARSSVDDALSFSVRPAAGSGGGTMDRQGISILAGDRETVRRELSVHDPSLWWPRGYGDQARYVVRVKLGDHALERTVGFRSVDRDEDGLLVNDERVRSRGFTRLPGDDPLADVERAVEANATLLRQRGVVPPRDFFEACDEAGVLIWQDLPQPGNELDVEARSARLAAIESAYGAHPSLALFGVHELSTDPYDRPLGDGTLSRLRFRWRAWRAGIPTATRTATATVADDTDERFATIRSVGPPGTGADATDLSPGWRYLSAEDVDWLLDRYPDLGGTVGSFGTVSIVDGEASSLPIPEGDRRALERRCPVPDESGSYQAETMRTVVDSLRRRGTPIVIGAALRDPVLGGGSGVLAVDGTPKPAFEAMRGAFEPVRAIPDGPLSGDRVDVRVVNDTPEPVDVTLGWRAGETTDVTDVRVDSHDSAIGATAALSGTVEALELECAVRGERMQHRYPVY